MKGKCFLFLEFMSILLCLLIFSCKDNTNIDNINIQKYLQAKKLFNEALYNQSLLKLQEIEKIDTLKNNVNFLQGKNYFFLSLYDKALVKFLLNTNSNESFIWQARTYFQKENYEKAISILNYLLEKDETDPRVYALAADVYNAKGNTDTAILLYKKALLYENDLAKARFEYARLLYKYKQFDTAILELKNNSIILEAENPMAQASSDLLKILMKDGKK